MDLVYVDTNVYIDWILNRRGRRFMIHQGEDAANMFNNIREDPQYGLVTSDHLEKQISIHLEDDTLYRELVKNLDEKEKRVHVKSTYSDRQTANQQAKAHTTEFEDALHFVLALKGKAKFLVTQDEPHFSPFRKCITIRSPRLLGVL